MCGIHFFVFGILYFSIKRTEWLFKMLSLKAIDLNCDKAYHQDIWYNSCSYRGWNHICENEFIKEVLLPYLETGYTSGPHKGYISRLCEVFREYIELISVEGEDPDVVHWEIPCSIAKTGN